jgi:hypothetical protein
MPEVPEVEKVETEPDVPPIQTFTVLRDEEEGTADNGSQIEYGFMTTLEGAPLPWVSWEEPIPPGHFRTYMMLPRQLVEALGVPEKIIISLEVAEEENADQMKLA